MTGGWRERARREKERIRKQKERERKRRKEKKEVKGAPVSAMLELAQTNKQKRSAVRHYNIHHVPGKALTFEDRQLLAADWNRMVKAGRKPSLRKFARDHGLPYPTWRREYGRGMTGETVPDPRNSSRRTYAEYDAGVAQDKVNQSVANRGPKMKFTNQIDSRFTYWVKDRRLSPYDARFHLVEEFGEGKVPCTRTLYNHIENGDCGVHHGETPYHPSMKRRAKARAHPAKTCPEHLSIKDRPKAADERSEAGHFEMDTVVSRLGGAGGLLVAIDRMTREYFIELVDHIGQEDIAAALARMKARGALAGIRSMSTDNGCEFLDQTALAKVLGCEIYYTRAYASYEKGSVENCNRLVRRWYPKGTDFSTCRRADIACLERTINGIHRFALGGLSASEYAKKVAREVV